MGPPGPWSALDLRELWEYRGLFFFFVWRDVKVRYAQTVLGLAWAVVQPVLAMVVFSVIFGRVANVPSDGVPYPVFSLTALVIWNYSSNALTQSSASLASNTRFLTKIYFPRLIIPSARILAGLVDFAVAFGVLLAMMAWYGIAPQPSVVLLPFLILLAIMTVSGVGFFLSAINIQYRDVKYVVPFLVQVWMYGSPVVYPSSMIPEQYRMLYGLNPMVGVIEGFRAVLLGTIPVPWGDLLSAAVVSTIIFFAGALYFRHAERVFADVA